VIDERTGLEYREWTTDLDVIREINRSYGQVPISPGATVLDLGGHVGAFVQWALAQGAGKVVTVEADPANAELLGENVHRLGAADHVWVLAGAVVDEPGDVVFFRATGTSYAHGSLMTRRNKNPIPVSGYPLAALLTEHRPSVVKCDIEGGEYVLSALHRLPATVSALTMELHNKAGWMPAEAERLVASFRRQGFKALRAPRFTARWRATCGTWAR